MEEYNQENIDDFMEREKHYKQKIEQLEDDLEKERNIYDISNKNSEILNNLKNDISSKEKEIQEITAQNTKQKEELELVSHEIDLKLKKLSDTTQIVNIKKRDNQFQSNEDIKMKEKQISNINNIIEMLQNENDKLKIKLDFLNHNNGVGGEKFKLLELDKKILSLNKDIKKKKLLVQEHIKCASIKNQILKKINLIQKEIYTERETSNKLKKKVGAIGNKYMQIKQEYENKSKNQRFSRGNKKIYLKKEPYTKNAFNQNELNAILYAVNNNKTVFFDILKKLNVNEDIINNINLDENNNIKLMENQIEIFQNKQKANIEKSNKLLEQINEVEQNNNNKNKKINFLKNELDNLLGKQDVNQNENNDFNEKEKDKIINNKINSNFKRIKIDANKNKEDNS
jgi:hypothetical protein